MVRGFRPETFRAPGSRLLALVVLVLVLIGEVNVVLSAPRSSALPAAIALALVGIAVVLTFLRPRLDVTDDGVRVVNPIRTRFIPWASIRSVRNRFVLVIDTADGPVSVWAVPRPSAGGNIADIRRDPFGLPDYTAEAQHLRQDAAASTASAAQRVIEQQLEARNEER